MSQTSLASWQPARRHPQTYPGACPEGSYVIIDDRVHALAFAEPGALDSAYAMVADAHVPLDALLRERGLPPLADRYVSLAYGANRNPGTLAIKMHNYGYERQDGLVLPVLKGATRGRDVVACGLSGQGYLYADLLLADDAAAEVAIEAWFPLLDLGQLRVMHDGEHVRDGTYTVARFPSRLDGFDHPVEALGYAGNDPIFVSPTLRTPIAYSTVYVDHRSLPAMDATGMIDHVLDLDRLRVRVAEILEAAEVSTTRRFMAFMNARWWIKFLGAEEPDDRYDRLVRELTAVIRANQHPHSSAETMTRRGLSLGIDAAYRPSFDQRLGEQVAGR